MTMDSNIDRFASAFDPITLAHLNAKAEMMVRIDNKYIVKSEQLLALVPEFCKTFDILEIEDKRAFTYDSRYFDDAERRTFREHHQGRRRRLKVRARTYKDAGLCFLEVKVKGLRGMTEKHRVTYDPRDLASLTPDAVAFASDTYTRQYDTPFDFNLRPSIDVHYKRMTLVARAGGERMTIDTDLRFQSEDKAVAVGTGLYVVETKSANGRGIADVLLRAAGERPTNNCSKYCVGMAATGQVKSYNRFLPALRQLGLTQPQPTSGKWSEIRTDLINCPAFPEQRLMAG